jgi:hypothetical protein
MNVLVGTVALSLVAMGGETPSPTAREPGPRLLVELAATVQPASVHVTVRNLSSHPVSFRGLTRAALRRGEEGWGSSPPYWAPVDLRSARSPETSEARPVRLGPGAAQELVLDLRQLAWAAGDCACWPDGTLTRVVLPGRYDLMVEIGEADSGFWWRSNTAAAVMKRSRAFEVSFD